VQSRSSRRRPLAATYNTHCHRALQDYQVTQSRTYTVSWITNNNNNNNNNNDNNVY